MKPIRRSFTRTYPETDFLARIIASGATLYRRLHYELRGQGVLGATHRCLVLLLRLIQKLRPSRRRARATKRAIDTTFDRTYGVDTGGTMSTAAMHDVEGENWVHGASYEATNPEAFNEMIGASDIDPQCYSFIDYGSGKGRVLLLASQLPFQKVIGVEYSPSLHQLAQQNLHSVQLADRRAGLVEAVCMDAVRHPIPEEPVVLYINHSFKRPVMERMRDNVVRSYEGNRRSIVVIYHHPWLPDVWDSVGFFSRHACSNTKGCEYIIYKS